MSVLDDYLVDPRPSLLDKTRIQAQVLVPVPVLRVLRSELGKERADAILRQALRDWSRQLFAAVGAGVDGGSRRKWAAMHSAMAEITEQDVTVEMCRHDKDVLEFDVTHCRFAEFFRALGEAELGALLICETDFDIAEAGSGEVRFTRNRTIMQGAPSCTFRYGFSPRSRIPG
jgi:predicted ArsR family transcriptional regulator